MPAEPQQISASAISRSSRPGISRSSSRRLAADALGVREVAGVVVGHGHRRADAARRPCPARRGTPRRRGRRAARRAARSAYCSSSASRSAYSFIVEPHPAALTTTRSTPARSKTSTSLRAKSRGLLGPAGVLAQRAAATLRAGGDDVEALGGEHPRRRGVDAGEELALDAAEQHADGAAARAPRRRVLGHPLGAGDRGGERFHGGQLRGQALQRAAQPRRQARLLPGAQRAAQRAQPPRVREEAEDRRAQGPLGRRAVVVALDLRARRLDELVVLHAGRARRHARHAARGRRRSARPSSRSSARPRGPVPSGRCARGASPSPRPTARRWGRTAGRSRSARSRRRASADGGWSSSKAVARDAGRRPAGPDPTAVPAVASTGWPVPDGCVIRCLRRTGRARAGARGRTGP